MSFAACHMQSYKWEAGLCSISCISLWLTCRHEPQCKTSLEEREVAHSLAKSNAAPLDGKSAPLLGIAADSSGAQAKSDLPASNSIAAALCSVQVVEGAGGLGPGAVPGPQVPAAALLVSELAAQALANGNPASAGEAVVGARRMGLAACHRHSQALDGGAEQWQRAALPPAPSLGASAASAATMLPSPASAPDLQQAQAPAPQGARLLGSANGPVAVAVPSLDQQDPSVIVMQVCRALTLT